MFAGAGQLTRATGFSDFAGEQVQVWGGPRDVPAARVHPTQLRLPSALHWSTVVVEEPEAVQASVLGRGVSSRARLIPHRRDSKLGESPQLRPPANTALNLQNRGGPGAWEGRGWEASQGFTPHTLLGHLVGAQASGVLRNRAGIKSLVLRSLSEEPLRRRGTGRERDGVQSLATRAKSWNREW